MRSLAAGVLLAALAPVVHGSEAWHEVYATAGSKVAVDAASLRREKQIVSFRERHVLLAAEVDAASLRPIAEIQYRRLADCQTKRLARLSRAMFSDADALVHYEAARPGRTQWAPPRGDEERRVYEWVCGARADSASAE
jgi:hypothetical protein